MNEYFEVTSFVCLPMYGGFIDPKRSFVAIYLEAEEAADGLQGCQGILLQVLVEPNEAVARVERRRVPQVPQRRPPRVRLTKMYIEFNNVIEERTTRRRGICKRLLTHSLTHLPIAAVSSAASCRRSESQEKMPPVAVRVSATRAGSRSTTK